MSTVCLFSSHLKSEGIPFYVKHYLAELLRHFPETVFICNDDIKLRTADQSWLKEKGIRLMQVKNEGFDFGMWHKAMKTMDLNSCERLVLANDSCVLFAPLGKMLSRIDASGFDYCGLVDSGQIAWHVQSYFLSLSKKAILPFFEFLEAKGIVNDYRRVIDTYEVALPAYFASKSISCGAVFSFREKDMNPSFIKAGELMEEGLPLLKRKIVNRSLPLVQLKDFMAGGFNPHPGYYTAKAEKITGDRPLCASLFGEWNGASKKLAYGLKIVAARIYLSLRK